MEKLKPIKPIKTTEIGARLLFTFLGVKKEGTVIEYDKGDTYCKIKGDDGTTYPCAHFNRYVIKKKKRNKNEESNTCWVVKTLDGTESELVSESVKITEAKKPTSKRIRKRRNGKK